MKQNLHSHTQFCDGRASMEEILESANKAGFTTWGFTPHSPICIESPCNMKAEDVGKYLAEIKRLRKLYPEINILAGMEVDFLDEEHGPSSQDVKGYGLDYIIGSVHFIPNQKGEFFDIDGSPERFQKVLKDHFNNDLNYVVSTFWLQTQKMLQAGGFHIIGHIDKIALNASSVDPDIEEDTEYIKLSNETIDLAIRKGVAIEINTKHYKKYGRFFPHPRFWKHIIDSGTKMPVNSDTHYAELVEDGIEAAFTQLKKIIQP